MSLTIRKKIQDEIQTYNNNPQKQEQIKKNIKKILIKGLNGDQKHEWITAAKEKKNQLEPILGSDRPDIQQLIQSDIAETLLKVKEEETNGGLPPGSGYLLEHTEAANTSNQNIINLFETKEERNIILAFELLKGGGMIPTTKDYITNKINSDQYFLLSALEHSGNLLDDVFAKIKYADFSNMSLTCLPDSFGKLKNLQTLYLYGNQLSTLPDSFENLTSLQTLHLKDNQLSALPKSFGKLTSLQTLHLEINQLSALPDSFGNLTSLLTLDLYGNQLSALPRSFGKLTSLQRLDLVKNQLSALPDSFGKLKNLQELYLENNQLLALPDSFGKLTSLQTLYLENNQLSALPDSFGKLTSLQRLNLYGNNFSKEEQEKKNGFLPHCKVYF